MSKITGADGVLALKMADTWGTAETLGADDRFEAESVEENRNPEALEANPLGSGRIMANDAQQGATTPTANIEKLLHFNDAGMAAVVAHFGGESIVTIGATGAYYHSILQNEAVTPRFVTYARQYVSQSILEMGTAVVPNLTFTFNPPPDYARMSFELLGNDIAYESTTNTYAILENNTTVSDTERIVGDPSDEFLINGQTSAALASPTNRLAITSLVLSSEKPHESAREYKGSSGNGTPFPNGSPPLTQTLTVTLQSAEEVTWWRASAAGTEYKASFTVTGSTIGGGISKGLTLYFPRLKLIEEPSNPISSGGVNPVTLTFKCLVADSVPSGMCDRYPHAVVTNAKSTRWYDDV